MTAAGGNSKTAANEKIDICLTSRLAYVTVFQNQSRVARLMRRRAAALATMGVAAARRKVVKSLINKQS
jgi:hypothetical protein